MKNAGTVIPFIGFVIALGIVAIDTKAADGPLSQAYARAADYGHALQRGDVAGAKAFHLDGGPAVTALVSTLEDGVFRIDSASVETAGGQARVATTLLWATASGSGSYVMTVEWIQINGIWKIADTRSGPPGA